MSSNSPTSYPHKTEEGVEPGFSLYFKTFQKTGENPQVFSFRNKMCTIWDSVRTYLTRDIGPKEKTALIVAIKHFQEKERS